MDIRNVNIVSGIKNEAFKNALMSHGLGGDSKLNEFFNSFAKAGQKIRNSTEPRMIMYTAEINEYLYSDQEFMMKSQNDSQFAASGEIKKLQDSVIGPGVTKGRVYAQSLAHGANAPVATVKVRKNTSRDWPIEYFHTNPDVITRELTSEVPYEVRQELLKAHAQNLMQSVANFTAVEWAQGSTTTATTVNVNTGSNFYVFTTGANRANAVVNNADQQVKSVAENDIIALKTALQRQNIMQLGGSMYFLPTVEQYEDLLKIPSFKRYDALGKAGVIENGVIAMLYGIKILNPRHRADWGANVLYSYTALSNNTTDLTKVEDTASAAANMTSAGIAWIDTAVLRAQGSAIVFPWMNSPLYFGDVYATEMRYGATKKRGDNNGVVMLVDNPFTS